LAISKRLFLSLFVAAGIVLTACHCALAADQPVLVAFLYDRTCKIACSRVRPIFKEIQQQYAGKVEFVELDLDQQASEKTAKRLKILAFYNDHIDWFPVIGVFTGKDHKLVKEILGSKSKEIYEQAIEKALRVEK